MTTDYGNYNAMKYMGPHSTEDYPRFKKIADSKAAQIFGELDRADGQEDGKVSADIWNEYAEKNGGKPIKHEIDIWNGINSITTYEIKKAQEQQQE